MVALRRVEREREGADETVSWVDMRANRPNSGSNRKIRF